MKFKQLYNLVFERIGGNIIDYIDFKYNGEKYIRGQLTYEYEFSIIGYNNTSMQYLVYFAPLSLSAFGLPHDKTVISIGFTSASGDVEADTQDKTNQYRASEVITYIVACMKHFIDTVIDKQYDGFIFQTIQEKNKNQRSKLYNYFIKKYINEFNIDILHIEKNSRYELFLTTKFPERLSER